MVPAGPFEAEKLEDIKDELRAMLRKQMLDQLGWTEPIPEKTLIRYLETMWRVAPDPFFIILTDVEKHLRSWIEADPLLGSLLIYEIDENAKSELTVDVGDLVALINTFVRNLSSN